MNSEPIVSQDDGKVTITGLSPGDYKFVETKAPDGYILNSSEIPFTIDETSHDKPKTVTTQADGSPLELANHKGSVEFVKKDKSGKVLEGAEFDLLDTEGKRSIKNRLHLIKTGKYMLII